MNILRMYFLDIYNFFVRDTSFLSVLCLGRHDTIIGLACFGRAEPSLKYLGTT
jgi:hypothetical protein